MRERLLTIGAALVGLGALGGVAFLIATRRFEVEGRSMLPAYAPGDHLLVNRLAYLRSRPSIGDVVVVRQERAGGRLDVKRIAAGPGENVEVQGVQRELGQDEWYVLGDNASESTDSRELGPVSTGDIVGKVLLRY
jgi:signal peptidase I